MQRLRGFQAHDKKSGHQCDQRQNYSPPGNHGERLNAENAAERRDQAKARPDQHKIDVGGNENSPGKLMGRSHCAVPLDKQGHGANNADRGQYGG